MLAPLNDARPPGAGFLALPVPDGHFPREAAPAARIDGSGIRKPRIANRRTANADAARFPDEIYRRPGRTNIALPPCMDSRGRARLRGAPIGDRGTPVGDPRLSDA